MSSSQTSLIRVFDARRVRPLPDQPRKRFKGIKELTESIAEVGQISNGVVTLVNDDPDFDAQLVDGERRLRACQLAGVPFRAEICADGEGGEIFVKSFAANFGKQDHDAVEIAEALERIRLSGKTIEQLGRIAGRSNNWVYMHLNLLRLHPDVRGMLIASDGEDSPPLTFSIAQLLVPLPLDQQLNVAKHLIAGDAMSLAAARRYVLNVRAKSGVGLAHKGKTGKARTIASIGSLVETASERIGIYLDMPGKDFDSLVGGMTDRERARLITALNGLHQNLSDFKESVEDLAGVGGGGKLNFNSIQWEVLHVRAKCKAA